MLNVHRDSGDNGLDEVGWALRRSGAGKAKSMKDQGGNALNAGEGKTLSACGIFLCSPYIQGMHTV